MTQFWQICANFFANFFAKIFVFPKVFAKFIGRLKFARRFKFYFCFCNVRNVFGQDCPSLEADRAECQKLQTAKKNVEVFSIWQLLNKGGIACDIWCDFTE
jgi:hypothetical protein